MKLGSRHISKNTMRLLTPLGISLPLMAQAPGSSDGTAIGVSVASAMMLATGLSAAGYAYLKHRHLKRSPEDEGHPGDLALELIANAKDAIVMITEAGLIMNIDRKSTRLNSSHPRLSRMPSSA